MRAGCSSLATSIASFNFSSLSSVESDAITSSPMLAFIRRKSSRWLLIKSTISLHHQCHIVKSLRVNVTKVLFAYALHTMSLNPCTRWWFTSNKLRLKKNVEVPPNLPGNKFHKVHTLDATGEFPNHIIDQKLKLFRKLMIRCKWCIPQICNPLINHRFCQIIHCSLDWWRVYVMSPPATLHSWHN